MVVDLVLFVYYMSLEFIFFFSSRRRHTRCALVTGVQTCALPIYAQAVLDELAGIFARFGNSIRVEGYTDNRPINTVVFPSNWELSAARAASVVRRFAEHGVAPERLGIIGWGEQRPAASNDRAGGRNQKRRVWIVGLGHGSQSK